MKTKIKRYSLHKGKYGCYFHDGMVKIDMTLEMVLDKLNRIEALREHRNFLINEVSQLKNKIVLLKENVELNFLKKLLEKEI